MSVTQAEMTAALRRIRVAEHEAQVAAGRGDSYECYAALERCQHAAFDAKALCSGEACDWAPVTLT